MDDEELADSVAKLRDCGRTSRYSHDVVGFTSRLNTCNAAIGLVQLKRLDAWNERRRAIARIYDPRLKGLPGIVLPPGEEADKRPVYHCYAILSEGREGLSRHLADRGIVTAVHYPIPIHRQAAYAEKGRGRHGDLPVSEMLSQRILSLPMFPSMTDDQVRRVCEAVQSFGE